MKALILVLSPWGRFGIPEKPLIYFLPTHQQYALTELLSNVKYHSNAEYVKAEMKFHSEQTLGSGGST